MLAARGDGSLMLGKKKPKRKLSAAEGEDRADLKAARAALRQIKVTGTIPWSQIKKELGLP
jgi:hypothetical protein